MFTCLIMHKQAMRELFTVRNTGWTPHFIMQDYPTWHCYSSAGTPIQQRPVVLFWAIGVVEFLSRMRKESARLSSNFSGRLSVCPSLNQKIRHLFISHELVMQMLSNLKNRFTGWICRTCLKIGCLNSFFHIKFIICCVFGLKKILNMPK